jgi:hypothetical protein
VNSVVATDFAQCCMFAPFIVMIEVFFVYPLTTDLAYEVFKIVDRLLLVGHVELLCLLRLVKVSDARDLLFTLGTPVLTLLHPLLDALETVRVDTIVQSSFYLSRNFFQADCTSAQLLLLRHFGKRLTIRVDQFSETTLFLSAFGLRKHATGINLLF